MKVYYLANETCLQMKCSVHASTYGYCVRHYQQYRINKLDRELKELRTAIQVCARVLANRKLRVIP